MNKSIGIGVAGIFAATLVATFAPATIGNLALIAGVAIYYFGILGYLGISKRTGVRLFDEREARIEQKASQIVVFALVVVTLFALPADLVFEATGIVDVPVFVRGAIWGYGILFGFILIVYGSVEKQYR